MSAELAVALCAAFAIVAALYSSVGHAGASGYLAVMALCGLARDVAKPTALVLNLVVASLGTWRFVRAGHFRWRLFWPFGVTTLPVAWFAAGLHVDERIYKPLLGCVLLVASARLLFSGRDAEVADPRPPRPPVALLCGAAIGFISGITGTGGGIFLSPLALLRRWARVREVSALASAFILATSLGGLVGHSSTAGLPRELPWFAGSVLVGALLGTSLGTARLDARVLRRLLGVVLVIAGLKLLAEGVARLLA